MEPSTDTKHHYFYDPDNELACKTIDVQKMRDEAEKRLADKFAPWESIIHYHQHGSICHYEADRHMEVKRQRHDEFLFVQAISIEPTEDVTPAEPKFDKKRSKKWD